MRGTTSRSCVPKNTRSHSCPPYSLTKGRPGQNARFRRALPPHYSQPAKTCAPTRCSAARHPCASHRAPRATQTGRLGLARATRSGLGCWVRGRGGAPGAGPIVVPHAAPQEGAAAGRLVIVACGSSVEPVGAQPCERPLAEYHFGARRRRKAAQQLK